MKRITVFLVVIPIVLFFNCSRERDEEPRRVNAIERMWVLPGDKVVYLQWSVNDSSDEVFSSEFWGVKIYRADSSPTGFIMIKEKWYDNRLLFGLIDSTVQNSIHYEYYIKVTFHSEIATPYDISDTLSVVPYLGAPDPIPTAPASLTIVAEGDSFLMSWVPPENCDSLYYLLMSTDNQYYEHDELNWNPNPYDPIELEIPQYYFSNLHDGKIRYYKVIALVDSILSYPSECDSIKHE